MLTPLLSLQAIARIYNHPSSLMHPQNFSADQIQTMDQVHTIVADDWAQPNGRARASKEDRGVADAA
jgi:hypothetical protein